jgi:site-specific recombinase XerD
MNNKTLSYFIREFLVTYLGTRRNCSINTIQSYRDTIQLFINYNITEKNVNPSKLNFDILNIENVNEFLDYLEKNRNSTINTRNQRLACIKSLCNYILTYETTNLETFQKILNIKSKKHNSKTIDFLTKEEIKELLNKPNSSTKQGLKDLTVLTLLYDGALRVSELINLKTEDIILDEPSSIIIKQAKGNKSRVIPLTKNATEILKRYKQNFNLESGMIFIQSNQKEAYTSNGIRKIIKKYSNNFRFNITPHTFRHTKASHLVESNVPLIYIRDFLGHESIETTEIYAKVNNKIKDKIIAENTVKLGINVKYNIDEDPNLLNWLKSL